MGVVCIVTKNLTNRRMHMTNTFSGRQTHGRFPKPASSQSDGKGLLVGNLPPPPLPARHILSMLRARSWPEAAPATLPARLSPITPPSLRSQVPVEAALPQPVWRQRWRPIGSTKVRSPAPAPCMRREHRLMLAKPPMRASSPTLLALRLPLTLTH